MTEYVINRDKKDLIKFMKFKADKLGLQCKFEKEGFVVESKPGVDMRTQTPIPVMFKGKLIEEDMQTRLTGRFTYGFYLTTLVIVAAILIVARFIWSAYQRQTDNIILCAAVTVLLIIVCAVAKVKGRALKKRISEFLAGLNKR